MSSCLFGHHYHRCRDKNTNLHQWILEDLQSMVLKLDPVWLPVVKHNVTKHICLKSSNLTWKQWTGRANSWTVHSWIIIIIIIIIIIKQSTDRSILKKKSANYSSPTWFKPFIKFKLRGISLQMFKKKRKMSSFSSFHLQSKRGLKT